MLLLLHVFNFIFGIYVFATGFEEARCFMAADGDNYQRARWALMVMIFGAMASVGAIV